MEARGRLLGSSKTSGSEGTPVTSDGGDEFDSQRSSSSEASSQDVPRRALRKRQLQRTPPKKKDSFQSEIDKWELFYDDMKAYLADGTLNPRSQSNILKQAHTFFLSHNQQLYFNKTLRDGSMTITLPVVRSYQDRMEVCRRIHQATGEECIHHRRDTMLEILGKQYYWKGQRRDVCQCIASCEMCSVGLGGKRRAKPPGQRRDICPTLKIPRTDAPSSPSSQIASGASYISAHSSSSSTSPSTTDTTSSSASSSVAQRPTHTDSNSLSSSHCLNGTTNSRTSENELVSHTQSYTSTVPATTTEIQHDAMKGSGVAIFSPDSNHCSSLRPQSTNSFSVTPNSAFTPVDPLANLYTIAEACLLNNSNPEASSAVIQTSRSNPELSIASEVTVSDNSGLQIFTTINEPYCEMQEGSNAQVDQQVHMSPCVGTSAVPTAAGDEEQYVVQGSTSSCGASEVVVSDNAEPSIYQLLFQLPSHPSSSLCTAVIESMQMALRSDTDPCQLAQAAGQSLISVFNLSPSTSTAVVCPSRCAAYLTSLTSVLSQQGLLNATCEMNLAPPIILHDAICNAGSLKQCSSLLGACNWNLGTQTLPMDKDLLQATVTSNRVAAVLCRPFAYPANTSFLTVSEISSLCSPCGTAVIVDCSIAAGNTLGQLTASIKEILMMGADLIMLPSTEHFQGPPHTCILIGKSHLLSRYWEQVSTLQSRLPFPLFCTSYDMVGCVVAYKSLQVTGFKSEPVIN